MLIQDGLVPPLHPEEASGLISGSEQILKNYANKLSLNDIVYDVVYDVVYDKVIYNIVYDIVYVNLYRMSYTIYC